MSESATTSAKRGGENAEGAVIDLVSELEYVPDTEAEHYDARTTTLLEPSETIPFVGMCLLEAGVAVEIKSVMVVYGANSSNGRFYLRKGQHERILDEAGVYLFAVCEPRPSRPVIAMKVVPATIVDDLISSWINAGDRPTYAQISWSKVFDPEEVGA